MGVQQIAAAAAAALVFAAGPCRAWEPLDTEPSTTFYISIPLDARSARERLPAFGIAVQGSRRYESVRLDTRMFRLLPLGGIEAKWILAGALALGATAAIAKQDEAAEERIAEQRAQEEQKRESCSRIC